MTQFTGSLIERRLALVEEHVAAECAHDIPRALRTFRTPHYWVKPFSAVTSGAPAVSELLAGLFQAFPDFAFVMDRTYHASDAVVVEGRMTGTQRGEWAGVPASGKPIDVMCCCIFHFDGDQLTSESVYFDHATLLAQIGVR